MLLQVFRKFVDGHPVYSRTPLDYLPQADAAGSPGLLPNPILGTGPRRQAT